MVAFRTEREIVDSQKNLGAGKVGEFSFPVSSGNSFDLLAQIADRIETAVRIRNQSAAPLFISDDTGVKRYAVVSESFSAHRFEISAEAVGKLVELYRSSPDASVAGQGKIEALAASLNRGVVPSVEDRAAIFKPIIAVLIGKSSSPAKSEIVASPEVRLNALLDRLANPNPAVEAGAAQKPAELETGKAK